jgi:hypothetical protein
MHVIDFIEVHAVTRPACDDEAFVRPSEFPAEMQPSAVSFETNRVEIGTAVDCDVGLVPHRAYRDAGL